MAGHIFYDMAEGKPLTRIISGSDGRPSIVQDVDMLRQYSFEWIILDRWLDESSAVGEAGSEDETLLVRCEYSSDGIDFVPVEFCRAVICTDKGSRGSHRSLQTFFPAVVQARHFRLIYPQDAGTYIVRASLRPFQASAAENTKIVEGFALPFAGDAAKTQVTAAVIGASNSVLRGGWTAGLEAGGLSVKENVSLGSSSNSMLAVRLPALTGGAPDVLLIDTTVTEYIPMRDRRYDRELSRQLVRHAQAWAAQQGAIPVFVIYPNRLYFDDLAVGAASFNPIGYFVELCEDMDIAYVDGFALVVEMAAEWGRPVESLFLDGAHLSRGIAQILGAAIGERVRRFATLEMRDECYIVNPRVLTHPFSCVELSDEALHTDGARPQRVRTVATSLIKQPMITLYRGESVQVHVPDGWEVVAVTINARRCNASLAITGTNQVNKRMDFAAYGGDQGFPFVCVRSLETPVTSCEGFVTLTCVDPQLDFESDEITNDVLPERVPELQEIEIGQLVIRGPERTDRYVRLGGIGLDLTPGVDLSFAIEKKPVVMLGTCN